MDNVNEQNPADIAYMHSLSVKLVMQVESSGWTDIRDVKDLLPGPRLGHPAG